MKKTVLSVFMIVITLLLTGCTVNSSKNLTENQQAVIDTVWNNKSTWEQITGYVGSGNGACNYICFDEYSGKTVFTAYRMNESSNTISSNTYYVYPNGLVKMDQLESKMVTLGLFKGKKWSNNSTKEDLQNIYLDYETSKE